MRCWLIGIACVSGCGNMPTTPTPHNFAEINTQVLAKGCAAFSTCHSAQGARLAGMLDLATDPYAALVGVPATNAMAKAEGKLRVAPCDPDNSFLMIKLRLPLTATDPRTG